MWVIISVKINDGEKLQDPKAFAQAVEKFVESHGVNAEIIGLASENDPEIWDDEEFVEDEPV